MSWGIVVRVPVSGSVSALPLAAPRQPQRLRGLEVELRTGDRFLLSS